MSHRGRMKTRDVRPSVSLCAEELIPDRSQLRSVVYRTGVKLAGRNWLGFFCRRSTSSVWGFMVRNSSLPTPCSGHTPYLRELVLSRCAPWLKNQFRSLTSLSLAFQSDPDAHIYSSLDIIWCSPHLEELLLERSFQPALEPQHPPERKIPPVPLHSLKRLRICPLSARSTRRLLGALDLLPDGVSMRFSNVPMEFGTTFPDTITPELSPRAATKLEIVYPSTDGAITPRYERCSTYEVSAPILLGISPILPMDRGETSRSASPEGNLATHQAGLPLRSTIPPHFPRLGDAGRRNRPRRKV